MLSLSPRKCAFVRLRRWAGQPDAPDDDQAAREDLAAMELEHVITLDLAGSAAFKIEDSDLAKDLAMMGQAVDLCGSAKRAETRSTCFSYG